MIIPNINVVNPIILNGAKYEPLNNAIIPMIINIKPNKQTIIPIIEDTNAGLDIN